MDTSEALGHLPNKLREELLDAFNKIITNYRERKWEPSELNGGKLCEIVYSIIKGHVEGAYPPHSTKPKNMLYACKDLEQAPTTFPRSIRIQIPRMLIALYEVRNNRGVGHVGGEVNPNFMDASVVLHISKWIMAELVRLFHNLDTENAYKVVEIISEREIPLLWQINGRKRVLKPNLTMKEKTLLILYSEICLSELTLADWVEHTNASIYRRDILIKGHKTKLWEYDKKTHLVTLSPIGSRFVEENLLS